MAIDPNHTAAAAATIATNTTTTATTTSTTTTTARPIRPAPSPAAGPHSLVSAATQSTSSPVAAHQLGQGQGVLYPVASSGRGFIPRPIRPAPAVAGGEHTVTVANAGGAGGGGAASYASRAHISQQHLPPLQLMRPPYILAAPSPLPPPPVRGLPRSSTPPDLVSPPSSVPESNGFKDIRDKSRDDNLAVIRGRKVRMTDRSSLYVHCRSWLRNGFPEEIQPQYADAVRSLPKPSPIPKASVTVPKKEEGEVEEKEEKEQDNNKDKDEECVEHLSTDDLLKEHVKRARKVRARLREERLVRIERYKTRLALLLPPVGEQFRNDLAAGN